MKLTKSPTMEPAIRLDSKEVPLTMLRWQHIGVNAGLILTHLARGLAEVKLTYWR